MQLFEHSCALTRGGAIACAGDRAQALVDALDLDAEGTSWSAITLGEDRACALQGTRLWCASRDEAWGEAVTARFEGVRVDDALLEPGEALHLLTEQGQLELSLDASPEILRMHPDKDKAPRRFAQLRQGGASPGGGARWAPLFSYSDAAGTLLAQGGGSSFYDLDRFEESSRLALQGFVQDGVSRGCGLTLQGRLICLSWQSEQLFAPIDAGPFSALEPGEALDSYLALAEDGRLLELSVSRASASLTTHEVTLRASLRATQARTGAQPCLLEESGHIFCWGLTTGTAWWSEGSTTAKRRPRPWRSMSKWSS